MTKIWLNGMHVGEWEKVRDQLSMTGSLIGYRVVEGFDRTLNVNADVDLREPYAREIMKRFITPTWLID